MLTRAASTLTMRGVEKQEHLLHHRSILAEDITRAASKQTFYTIRWLVDRGRTADAYRAYAYFRWLDDTLDGDGMPPSERAAFVQRQQALIRFGERAPGGPLAPEEDLLITLLKHDPVLSSGLYAYIDHMMAVMAFDAGRRGRLITSREMANYQRHLAAAVTEALHYFIGHDDFAPVSSNRYCAAIGAHITHMLRDALDDTRAGYYNIPREVLQAHHLEPDQVEHPAYRAWVAQRVQQARACFRAGRDYLAQVQNLRCRAAGCLYIARFEGLLDVIERDGYCLRREYPSREKWQVGLGIAGAALVRLVQPHLAEGAQVGAIRKEAR